MHPSITSFQNKSNIENIMPKNSKRPRTELDAKLIVDEVEEIYEGKTDEEFLIYAADKENEIENFQRYEILKLKKRVEELTKKVKNLAADSKSQKKTIRKLRKNNLKKWKLLTADELRNMSWNEYALTIFNEKEIERYEELENCWYSSEESADEAEE